MISVHDRTATAFTATGLGVLDGEVIDPVVVEELGGEYVLSFQYPADGPAASALVLENIIACPVPGVQVRQGFRINEVTATLDGLVEVTCFHVFYDLAANLVADTFVVNKTAQAALDQILSSATTKHPFTATSSDAVTRASARIARMPLAQALMDGGEDNTFVARWGGEVTRDNWHIHHAARRGADRGVVIRDRKNLTGYQSSIDFSTVVTRILPVGYDGLLLPELYVDSPKVNSYVTPRIKVIRYSQVKAVSDPARPREDELPLPQAQAELRRLAALEYSANHIDEPEASYKVSFVDLASTKEYADLAQLEQVLLGDTVTVRHADLNVALSARVVAYEWNPLSGQYVSVELGSVAATFTSVTRQIKTAVSVAEQAQDVAGFALSSADGKNTNHYGTTQPAQARLGDTWFKQNGENTEIWIYQTDDTGRPGWVALATDLNHAQVSAELDAARTEVAEAKRQAELAQAAAEQAAQAVDAVQGEIDAAATAATQAEQKAREAQEAANTVSAGLAGVNKELDQAQQAVVQAQNDIHAVNALLAKKPDEARVKELVSVSASGKTQITLSTTPPSRDGVAVGDTWWQQDGNKKLVGQWSWDGTTWVATTLAHQVISSVDVGALTVAGQARMNQAVVDKIMGDAAFFGVLAANRVVVGDGTNLWPDPSLQLDYPSWTREAGGKLSKVGTGAQSGAYYPATRISVNEGEKYVGGFRFTRTDPAQVIKLHAQKRSATTGAWTYLGALAEATPNASATTGRVVAIPADTDMIQIGLFLEKHATVGVRATVWDIHVQRQTPAVLIEDGAVTATKIAANTITATHIQAGAVTSDKLTIANGFITNAMIANAAVNDAKIANLSANKITAGTLNAARIAAGSITSDKLTIANGFITNAMIRDAAVTDAKIGNLSASKITAGTLNAARIAAGSITSDKLTIANGFITNAMIRDLAVTSAKIAALDAGKITTGYLNANRIQARSISAEKLTSNAIQVGLAGWTSSIRISPTQVAWFDSNTLQGKITSRAMQFWYGTRFIGELARGGKKNAETIQGISMSLANQGDYVAWTYQNTSGGDYYTCLTLDPKGRFYGQAGIHLGADLYTHGYKLNTTGNRYVTLQDCTLTGKGTFAGWVSANGLAKLVFHTYDLMIVTNGSYYNMTRLFDRVTDLMSRVNTLITLLNNGWISTISGTGPDITWRYYDNTGLATMPTTLA